MQRGILQTSSGNAGDVQPVAKDYGPQNLSKKLDTSIDILVFSLYYSTI